MSDGNESKREWRLIHAYLGIDDDTVWSIVQDDIPPLLSALEKIRVTLR